MAIKIEKFEVGKDTTIVPINRFLKRTGLRSSNIISTELVTLGRDRSLMFITYNDDTAPYVINTFPSQGAENVALGTTAVFVFSEPIQPPGSADVSIYNVTDDVTVSNTLYTLDTSDAGDEAGGILRIIDSGDYLEGSHIYRITLESTIKDEAGNQMTEDFNLTFSMVADPAVVTNPEGSAGQRLLMLAGNRSLTVTTKRKYTLEPVLQVTIERDKVYGSIEDSTLTQNPDTTWNFIVQASHKAPTGGQYIHITERKQD